MTLDDADPRICWLGAFAMGLAVSSQSDEERIAELVEASAGDQAQLEAARRRIHGLRPGDPQVRRTAVQLLEAAIGELEEFEELEPIDLTTAEVAAGLETG